MRVAVWVSMLFPLVAFAAGPTEPDKKPRLIINEFVALKVSPEEASALGDAVSTYLTGRGLFDVLGPREVEVLLGAERRKQLMGQCVDDSVGCSLDVTKLTSARFLLTGQLAKVGSAYQLTLQLIDTERAQAVSRSSKLAGTLEALRQLVPYAASEATGSPLPPPPSRVLPISLIGVGGATLLSGGVVGLLALSKESQLNDELCPAGLPNDGRCTGVNLRSHDFYVAQQNALTVQKIVSVSLMGAGAVMLGLGLWLLPPDDARTRISARVVPMTDGFALVGGF
jgi:hypothetical protein